MSKHITKHDDVGVDSRATFRCHRRIEFLDKGSERVIAGKLVLGHFGADRKMPTVPATTLLVFKPN